MRRVTAAAATAAASAALALVLAPPSSAGTPGDPPGNDALQNAFPLLGQEGATSGTIDAATKQPGEPDHAGNPGGASVWWVWYSGFDQEVVFSTQGSSFDSLLAVYEGSETDSFDQLVPVASSDDVSGSLSWSGVQFEAEADTFYVVAVDGYREPAGPAPSRGDVELEFGPPEPYQTKFTKRPKKRIVTNKPYAPIIFGFKASGPAATFQCKLDGSGWLNCSSPQDYVLDAKRKARRHTIRVRAIDPYGNPDSTAAKTSFKIKRRR